MHRHGVAVRCRLGRFDPCQLTRFDLGMVWLIANIFIIPRRLKLLLVSI